MATSKERKLVNISSCCLVFLRASLEEDGEENVAGADAGGGVIGGDVECSRCLGCSQKSWTSPALKSGE